MYRQRIDTLCLRLKDYVHVHDCYVFLSKNVIKENLILVHFTAGKKNYRVVSKNSKEQYNIVIVFIVYIFICLFPDVFLCLL